MKEKLEKLLGIGMQIVILVLGSAILYFGFKFIYYGFKAVIK